MGFTATCLNNINSQPPPWNVPCTEAYCSSIQRTLDQDCINNGFPCNTPRIESDPDLDGPGKGGLCYCCCTCSPPVKSACEQYIEKQPSPSNFRCPPEFCAENQLAIDGWCKVEKYPEAVKMYDPDISSDCYCCCPAIMVTDLPVETSPGSYTLAHDLTGGRQVLAAGPELRWAPRAVTAATGSGSPPSEGPAVWLLARSASGPTRELVVGFDHLFLLANGTLRPVQRLSPGDRLRGADGGVAEVVAAVAGTASLRWAGIELGAFDGVDLDGHLLNTAGLVSADFAVQVAYFTGHLDPKLLAAPTHADPQPLVGSAAYRSLHGAAIEGAAPSAWPAGFTPDDGQIT